MKQSGVVISINGDRAKVVLQRHSSCAGCNACKIGDEATKIEVEAINSINAKIGDYVEVNMDHQNVLAAAFIAYALPLIALIVGVVIGGILFETVGLDQYSEIGAALLGLGLTSATYFGIKLKEKSIRENKTFVPIIVAFSNN